MMPCCVAASSLSQLWYITMKQNAWLAWVDSCCVACSCCVRQASMKIMMAFACNRWLCSGAAKLQLAGLNLPR